jgi:hypothetical protein
MSPYATASKYLYAYVEEVVHRQIGEYQYGSVYISNEDDYDPPYLMQKLSQPLYKLSVVGLPLQFLNSPVYVHPLDVITEEK